MVGMSTGLDRSWKDLGYSTSESLKDVKKATNKRQPMKRLPLRLK